METVTLNDINVETKEGQLLIAALSMLSTMGKYREQQPDEVLDAVNQIRLDIYEERTIY